MKWFKKKHLIKEVFILVHSSKDLSGKRAMMVVAWAAGRLDL